MRIINGKSSKKAKRSSAKKPNKGGLADDLFYTAEEFIAELTAAKSHPTDRKPIHLNESTIKHQLDDDVEEIQGKVSGQAAGQEKQSILLSEELDKHTDKSKKGDLDNAKKEYNGLLAKGIRLLSMREHSVKEITKKLSQKSESLNVIYAVVDELVDNNYLSDRRFAESFVRSRQLRGFGPNKIKMELKDKGIENNLIEDNLNVNSSIWFESAEQQYYKKYGAGPVDDYKTWAKRARFMQSRGFTMEHIDVVIPTISHD